jgi:hypothetical protein
MIPSFPDGKETAALRAAVTAQSEDCCKRNNHKRDHGAGRNNFDKREDNADSSHRRHSGERGGGS